MATLHSFQNQFFALSPQATLLAWWRLSHKYHLPPPPAGASGDQLLALCEERGLSHADVVVVLTPLPGEQAEEAITTLVGKPITRTRQPGSAPTERRRGPAPRRDPRIISWVASENPKKPGTRAHRLFELYRVGMTVDEFLNAGGRKSAIRHDTSHGFIRIGDQ